MSPLLASDSSCKVVLAMDRFQRSFSLVSRGFCRFTEICSRRYPPRKYLKGCPATTGSALTAWPVSESAVDADLLYETTAAGVSPANDVVQKTVTEKRWSEKIRRPAAHNVLTFDIYPPLFIGFVIGSTFR